MRIAEVRLVAEQCGEVNSGPVFKVEPTRFADSCGGMREESHNIYIYTF